MERENKSQAAALAAQRTQNQTFITDIDGKQISSLELVNSLPNGKIQTVNSMKYHSKTIKAKLGINFKFHYLRHQYVKPTTKTFSENNVVLDAKPPT